MSHTTELDDGFFIYHNSDFSGEIIISHKDSPWEAIDINLKILRQISNLIAKHKCEHSKKECDSCGNDRMELIMVKDELWSDISKEEGENAWLCRECMERNLGRPIVLDDLRYTDSGHGFKVMG
jgi:hypothetical protein